MRSGRVNKRINELPKISDTSGALPSRFIILTLTQSFYGHEDHGRLLPELPGIFAWALAGRRRLAKRDRFEMPKSSAAAVERLEMLASPILAFVQEKCVVEPGATIDLHSAVPGLRTSYPRDETSKRRYYAYGGIRLRAPADDQEPGW